MESIEEWIEGNSYFFTILFIICTFCGIFFGFLASYFNIIYIWLHKVDKKSTRHGGEVVAKVLKLHGVKYIFTLVGGHISPILVGAEKIGIKVIDTRHEATAVFAADAMARMSQSVGVAVVTAGPGLTNTVTAAKNAQMAESPVIIIGGASAGLLKGRGALQDIDQISLFSTICKYCATVTCVRDISPIMRRAFQEAQSGVPGPVFLEFPVDVLYPYGPVQKEVGQNAKSKLVRWYLNNYVDNIFAGAWEQQDELSPLPLNVPLPKDADGAGADGVAARVALRVHAAPGRLPRLRVRDGVARRQSQRRRLPQRPRRPPPVRGDVGLRAVAGAGPAGAVAGGPGQAGRGEHGGHPGAHLPAAAPRGPRRHHHHHPRPRGAGHHASRARRRGVRDGLRRRRRLRRPEGRRLFGGSRAGYRSPRYGGYGSRGNHHDGVKPTPGCEAIRDATAKATLHVTIRSTFCRIPGPLRIFWLGRLSLAGSGYRRRNRKSKFNDTLLT